MSIVIPACDRLAVLREATASVAAQSFPGWELIVVDYGSTDGSRGFLEAQCDPRWRALLRSSPDANPSENRNAGVRAARGRWLAFLDSDDVWLPEKLERQLAALRAAPDAGWSATGFEMLTGQARHPPRAGSGAVPASGWAFEALLGERGSAFISSVLVERTLFDGVGGFDEGLRYRADVDLVLRLAERSPLASVPDTLVLVREHAGRSTRLERDLLLSTTEAFERLLARTPQGPRRRLCRQAYARTLAWVARAEARSGSRRRARAAASRALRQYPASLSVWHALMAVAAAHLLVRRFGG